MGKRTFKQFVEQELGKVPLFFIYAVLEWVMILILFVDGFLAFFANEFAKFFELPIPCLLCTRIDHILVRRSADFYYNDSICEHHKKNVSLRAFCHAHKKLSDMRNMCETCLLSFATEKESDCDTYKSLLGILHKDIELFVDEHQELHLSWPASNNKKDYEGVLHQTSNDHHHRCSCCGAPLKTKVKSNHMKGKNNNNSSSLPSMAPAPTPRAPTNPAGLELSHIKYTELKLNSDDHSDQVSEDNSDCSKGITLEKSFREDHAKAAAIRLLMDADEEDKTPNFIRGNKFFGIPLSDSAANSPRWKRIARRSGLEKTEFAPESGEGQVPLHEIDGDILHHLKRQVRMDRKSLMALYMELDEERSASAVAANNAMAMITRLQAEKAAVQMEALQYQRMMEEQAEYDQEALQDLSNLLNKREEEIKELEAEVEAYRQNYGCLKESDFGGQGDDIDEDFQVFEPSSFFSSDNERADDFTSSPKTRSLNEGSNSNIEEKAAENHQSDSISKLQVNHDDQISDSKLQQQLNEVKSETVIDKLAKKKLFSATGRHLDRMRNLDKKMQISSDGRSVSLKYCSEGDYTTDEDTEETGQEYLKSELSQIHKKIEALAADGGLMKHVTHLTDEIGSEGAKLLTEISNNMHRLQQFVSMVPGFEDENA